MKLPNLRLYDTQAKFSLVLGLLSLLAAISMIYLVFRGFDSKQMAIYYNGNEGIGKYRSLLVMGTTAICVLVGATGGIMGFNSLGQKRNSKQGLSWVGLMTGAISIAMSIVLLFAWKQLSDPIITS
ncbi:MAG: hypothetical protein IPK83_11990 [Planctomycetes bacterium]|nr:hypothetical protein [Planctomycetota bacterium]